MTLSQLIKILQEFQDEINSDPEVQLELMGSLDVENVHVQSNSPDIEIGMSNGVFTLSSASVSLADLKKRNLTLESAVANGRSIGWCGECKSNTHPNWCKHSREAGHDLKERCRDPECCGNSETATDRNAR